MHAPPTRLAGPPPAGVKQWPLDARFGCALAGKKECECAASTGVDPLSENAAPQEQVMGPPAPVPLRAVSNRNDNGGGNKH